MPLSFSRDDIDLFPFENAQFWIKNSAFDYKTALRLREQIKHLHFLPSKQLQADINSYRDHYQLGKEALNHYMASVSVAGKKIVYQVFENSRPNASVVFLIHGYLDHLGVLRYLLDELIAMGHTVVAMDLAGHGLSGGKRGHIDDFDDYAHAIEAILNELKSSSLFSARQLDSIKAVGHSTGASALMLHQALYRPGFERMVFLAPLIRSYAHRLVKMSFKALSFFTRSLPRRTKGSSSNPYYYQFIKEYDPLMISRVPMAWARAYIAWESKSERLRSRPTPVLMIQGERDSVVSHRYNRRFISELYQHFEYFPLSRAKHNLATEPDELTDKMYHKMESFLKVKK